MQTTALPIPFYRAAGNRPPELSSTTMGSWRWGR